MSREPGRPSSWDRAIVIGSGIAGLATARVLADYFDQVLVVERDHDPDPGLLSRGGVPHGRHVHGLLAGGAHAMERLFPGLREQLASRGTLPFDHGVGMLSCLPQGVVPPTPTGMTIQMVSRGLLESVVRERVTALPQVRFLYGATVESLSTDPAGKAVTGVRLVRRTTAGGSGSAESHDGDLVVDCSGRFSKVVDWLTAAGFPEPHEKVVDPGLVYVSRLYEGPHCGWNGLIQPVQAPSHPRGVYVTRIEGRRLLITLFGCAGQEPPTDEDGFLAYAASLGNSELDKALAQDHPVTPVYRFGRTENRRRHLHRMRHWPSRLVVLGDAQCAFNPVYGQGMTVASRSALALGRRLAAAKRTGGPDRATDGFQRVLHRMTAYPWLLATAEDRAWEAIADGGHRPSLLARASCWYKARLFVSVLTDPHTFRTFVRVFHAMSPPTVLLRPRVVRSVLRRRG